MNNSEYFKEIAANVHESRKKGEMTAKEMEIFRQGKVAALKEVLLEMNEIHTFADLRKRCENMQKFLNAQRSGKKHATDEGERDLWLDSRYLWTPEELMNFIALNVSDYRMRLKKAREIVSSQNKLIANFGQLSTE